MGVRDFIYFPHFPTATILRNIRKLVDATWRKYIKFPAAPQARYRSGDLGRIGEYAACNRTSPSRSGHRLRRKGLPLPDGDTFLRRVRRRPWRMAAEDFQRAVQAQVRRAQRAGLLRGWMNGAIDMEDVEYYGKRCWFTVGGKAKNGTQKFLRFAVLSVIVQGQKMVVAAVPVFHWSPPEVVVGELLDLCPVHLRRVLLDRWFYNHHVLQMFTDFDIGYLACARRTPRTERARKEAQREGRNHTHMEVGDDPGFPHETLLLFTKSKGRWRYFVTNLRVRDHAEADRLMELYRKRWNVENSIRDKNPFQARTASRNYNVRYVLYALSLLYYNFWVLGNILLAVARGLQPEAPLWGWFDFRADLLEVAFPGIW